MGLSRISVVAAACLISLAACSQAPEPEPSAARPNIVFILADDLGYAEVGAYGQAKIRTPNIDRLAVEGMRFTDAYSGGAVCAPARSVLMSGLHTGHSAVRANGGGNPILDEDLTVAEILQLAGYRTGGFGKWGLGDIETSGVPWKQGFDVFFGYLHQVHAHFYYPEYLWDNDRQFPLEGNDRTKGEGIYSADVIHERAMAFLHDHVETAQALKAQSPDKTERPFFLYLAYTIPHGEYQVPEDSVAEYRGRFEEKPIKAQGEHDAQPEPYATYAGMITRLDRQVGDVLAALDELGIADDTLVIFTSDNGPSPPNGDLDMFASAGPLRGRKSMLYEGGIRVPFIARWKGKIQPGTESALPISFQDFLPTAAELAQAQSPGGIDGISIVPTLLGAEGQAEREHLYWEHPGGDLKDVYQAVRMGRWKAIRTENGAPLELYDLQTDLGETTDVAAQSPDIVQRAEELIASSHSEPRPHVRKGWPAE